MLKKTPKSVQELLTKGAVARLHTQDAKHSRLTALWQKAVGVTVLEHSRCVAVQGQTLLIYAQNGAWATRIRLLQHQILQTFKEYPEAQVRSLDIQIKPTLK